MEFPLWLICHIQYGPSISGLRLRWGNWPLSLKRQNSLSYLSRDSALVCKVWGAQTSCCCPSHIVQKENEINAALPLSGSYNARKRFWDLSSALICGKWEVYIAGTSRFHIPRAHHEKQVSIFFRASVLRE